MTATPASLAELQDAVRAAPRVLAVGAGTKPRLAAAADGTRRISTVRLRGITEYEPDEYTFTALAGTPVREIAAALADRGQYLPFDPPLAAAGATLGGTVAAGLSGPGRFRYGGLRDFILGVRFVDGDGRLLRMGGKVVKNAAGFDLPKFFVGSAGRFGVLGELTFKVFPRPAARLTLRLPAAGPAEIAARFSAIGRARWEAEALEAVPRNAAVYLRLAGPAPALAALAREVLGRWPGEVLSEGTAAEFWAGVGEFAWAHPGGLLAKVPLGPEQLPALAALAAGLADGRVHFGAGGSQAFLSLPAGGEPARLDAGLRDLGLAGLTLRGDAPLRLGRVADPAVAAAVKRALDPAGRFPALDPS
ncbi:MAG: FAD-binding protein [Opitutaceae bacterium]|nr:FAD-binding protein [Opitutaceae bacterium]